MKHSPWMLKRSLRQKIGRSLKHPYTVYAYYKTQMDKSAIPDLSILSILTAYATTPPLTIFFISFTIWAFHPLFIPGDLPLPILLGLLRRDDFRDKNWAVFSRVSSNSQFSNTSTDQQLESVRDECDRADGTVECEYELAESGTTTRRDSLDEIAVKGEEGDIDVLGISKFDRLMRADPWESFAYLKRLKEANVTLYVNTHGYFDYEDIYDFQMLVRQVVFAREWFERLKENAESGQISKLEKGKWPFGELAYGYEKDEDDYIHLQQNREEVLASVFREYQEEKNLKAVRENIEEQIEFQEHPSKSQVKTILQNPLCIGELRLKDQVVAREPELAVIDRETFQKVQRIRRDQSNKPAQANEIPDPVERAGRDFGVEYVISLVDSLGKQCRKCGGELRKNGSEERWGTTVQNYRCKNEECQYQGPLLTKREFDAIHQTLPTRCPWCPATERFDITRTPDAEWEFTYECKNCDCAFASNIVKGKYKRAMNNPELRFDWYNDRGRSELNENQAASAGGEGNESENETASENRALTEFST